MEELHYRSVVIIYSNTANIINLLIITIIICKSNLSVFD